MGEGQIAKDLQVHVGPVTLSGRKQRASFLEGAGNSLVSVFQGALEPHPQKHLPQVLSGCQSSFRRSHIAQFFNFKGNHSGKC